MKSAHLPAFCLLALAFGCAQQPAGDVADTVYTEVQNTIFKGEVVYAKD